MNCYPSQQTHIHRYFVSYSKLSLSDHTRKWDSSLGQQGVDFKFRYRNRRNLFMEQLRPTIFNWSWMTLKFQDNRSSIISIQAKWHTRIVSNLRKRKRKYETIDQDSMPSDCNPITPLRPSEHQSELRLLPAQTRNCKVYILQDVIFIQF